MGKRLERTKELPDEESVIPAPKTGMRFKDIADINNPFTDYDRFQVDLSWISEAHARAYESLKYATYELRKKDRIINDLHKQLDEKVTSEEHIPYYDPPKDKDMSEIIFIDEHRMAKVIGVLVSGLIILSGFWVLVGLAYLIL